VGKYHGTYHVDFKMVQQPSINIIIPTKDNLTYLKTCCFSIDQSTYANYIVTIVDNGSQDGHVERFYESLRGNYRYTVLKYDRPFNFSTINNYAVEKSVSTDLLLFLNDDTEVITKDWLEQMAQHVGRHGVAAVGAKLLYDNYRIQHAGVIIGIGGVAGHSHKYVPDSYPGYFSRPHIVQDVSAVTGACMMVSKKVFEEVGGFERMLPRAFNDVDFCLKLRSKGYKIVYTPYACLFHHESVSRGKDNHKDAGFNRAVRYMQDKWDCAHFRDPYYNPNLTLVDENFSFRSQ
jgi:GT2 family glycosyltransferase